MRLLLDTHATLWALFDPDRLSTAASEAIGDTSNDILVSVASAWEIAIKQGLGRLAPPAPLAEGMNDAGYLFLDISPEHCAAYADFPVERDHRDPFDRMLVVQARLEDCHLVSRDAQLDRYGVSRVW
jgi:PIN domain nuclease of toxin-antitoxin system